MGVADDDVALFGVSDPEGRLAFGVDPAEGVADVELVFPRYISAILFNCSRRRRVRV